MVKSVRAGSVVLAVLLVVGVFSIAAPSPAGAVPLAPTNLQPTSVTYPSGTAGNPSFTWNGIESALYYHIQIANNANFTGPLYDNLTYNTTFTPWNKLPVGPIYWRVSAFDGTGEGPFATPATFNVVKPDGPVLGTPVDNATLDYPNQPITFTWTYPALPAGVTVHHYHIQVSTSSSFISPAEYDIVPPRLTLLGNQNYGIDYYWRVAAVFTDNTQSAYSPGRHYQTSWKTKPTLVSPANGATVTDVELVWNPVIGATAYELQINKAVDFQGTMVYDQVVYSTRWQPLITLDNGSYYWRVKPRDYAGYFGTWSDSGGAAPVFTRAWNVQPAQNEPSAGATLGDPQTFSWSPIARASYYTVQIGTDPNYSPGTFKYCTSYENTFSVYTGPYQPGDCTVFPYGIDLYWRVIGVDTAGNSLGLYSTTRKFKRQAENVQLVSPVAYNGTVGTEATQPVILSWARNVAGVATFRVRVWNTTDPQNEILIVDIATQASTYALPKLDPANSYAWAISAFDSNGFETNTSPPRRALKIGAITTNTNLGLLTPADGFLTPQMPSMKWEPYTGANRYLVYLTPAGQSEVLIGDVSAAAYTFPNNPYGPGNYSWRVDAYTDGTKLKGSVSRTFTRTSLNENDVTYKGIAACWDGNVNNPPTCVRSRAPQFQWDPVPGATGYEVYVSLDRAFTNPFRLYRTPYTSLQPNEEYADNNAGGAYYWHVRPCTAGYTQCSEDPTGRLPKAQAFAKRSVGINPNDMFPKNTVDNPVPNAAKIKVPSNPASGGPTFSWPDYLTITSNAGYPIEAANYQIQVATDPTFPDFSLVDNQIVDQTYYTPYSVSYKFDTTLYWRVRPIDVFGNRLRWSDTTISPNQTIPSAFQRTLGTDLSSSMTVPAVNAVVTGDPTFQWTGTPMASYYTMELYKNQDVDVDNQGNPNMSPVNLFLQLSTPHLEITPYYNLPPGVWAWRLSITDAGLKQSAWSPGHKFTIAQRAPNLVTPLDDHVYIDDNDVVFGWQAVKGAALYNIDWTTDPSFATFDTMQTVMLNWAPLTPYAGSLAGVKYYWRVRAFDKDGTKLGTSSQTRSFTVKKGKPGIPPGLTSVGTAGTGTINWGEAAQGGAPITGYKITLTPGLNGAQSFTVTLGAGARTYTWLGMLNGQVYVATVQAINSVGTGPAAAVNVVPNGCAGTPFNDVTSNAPFCQEINWLYTEGISTGTKNPDGSVSFAPAAAVSREAMAAFLWRYAGKPAVSSTQFFADVTPSTYAGGINNDFYKAIQWMGISGLSTGSTNPQGGLPLYQRSDAVTRQAMAAFLHRFHGGDPASAIPTEFADVPPGAPFYLDIQWMKQKGLANGTLNPQGGLPLYFPNPAVSRQAMAAFLFRYDQLP